MDEYTGWRLITLFLLHEGLLQLACVLLLLWGVEIGRYTVNFITVVKVLLVIFLIIGGLIFFNPVNLSDGFAPFGVSGIMTGATSCFFGYVGYDEVRRLPLPNQLFR
jgi:amino acid transporter